MDYFSITKKTSVNPSKTLENLDEIIRKTVSFIINTVGTSNHSSLFYFLHKIWFQTATYAKLHVTWILAYSVRLCQGTHCLCFENSDKRLPCEVMFENGHTVWIVNTPCSHRGSLATNVILTAESRGRSKRPQWGHVNSFLPRSTWLSLVYVLGYALY
jgi:hypothetical protein